MKTQLEAAVYKSERQLSSEPINADNLILDFQPSRTVKNKYLWFKPPSLWYSARPLCHKAKHPPGQAPEKLMEGPRAGGAAAGHLLPHTSMNQQVTDNMPTEPTCQVQRQYGYLPTLCKISLWPALTGNSSEAGKGIPEHKV